MADLTPTIERGLLKAMLAGQLPELDPLVFSTEERVQLGQTIGDHLKRHRQPPSHRILLDSVSDSKVRMEVQRVVRLSDREMEYAIQEAREPLLARALEAALLHAQDAIDAGSLSDIEHVIRRAYASVEPKALPAAWAERRWERHQENQSGTGARYPTGLPTIDEALLGGLRPGDVGAILGSTNRGKSHVAVYLGAHHLTRGGRLLDVSLEGSQIMRLRRYDRSMTGMRSFEIVEDRERFDQWFEEHEVDPESFRQYSYPRKRLTVMGLSRLVEEAEQAWGEPGLLVLDYASLLRPLSERRDNHEAIAEIHEDLSSLIQDHKWACWTPFQTNRLGELQQESSEGVPDVGMGHAGDSYKAMQHLDYVLALCQSRHDRIKRRMKVSVKKAREGMQPEVVCLYDWGLSRIWEKDDGEAKE